VTSGPAIGFDGWPTEAVLAAMEANMAAHVAHLPARLPGATVVDGPDLVLVDAGVASDTFNVVCGARLDPDTADARIAGAIAHFRAKGAPFSWWVGPCSRPDDLGERLLARGLVDAEGELGMALDLARLTVPNAPTAGLDVRRATSPEELRGFARVVAANWDPPDQAVVDVYERAAAAVLEPESPLRCYVGYLDGEPVSASECFVGHGVAGLYAVVTLRQARRRGFGTALTAAPLLDARASGYRTATLQASAGGQGIYARLGFLPCGAFREYKPSTTPALGS
jgi:ribosomal protein S18 acetylase RimI-like enzyme